MPFKPDACHLEILQVLDRFHQGVDATCVFVRGTASRSRRRVRNETRGRSWKPVKGHAHLRLKAVPVLLLEAELATKYDDAKGWHARLRDLETRVLVKKVPAKGRIWSWAPLRYKRDDGAIIWIGEPECETVNVYLRGQPIERCCADPAVAYKVTAAGYAVLDSVANNTKPAVDVHPSVVFHN